MKKNVKKLCIKKLIFFNFFGLYFTFNFLKPSVKMTTKLTKIFIEFASDIVSGNTSLEQEEVKSILSKKDIRQQFEEFLKTNKIKQKKDKKDTHSDEPKKPKTAYIIFCSAERDGVVDANPGIDHKEICSLLGQRWKEIQSNEKDVFDKYNDAALKEKAEYEEKMKEYRILHNIPEKIEKVKKPKVAKPEKAMSPFYYYLKDMESEVAEANPNMKKKEIHEKIKADWKELKDEKDDIVKKYKKMAKDKKNELKTVISASTQTSPISSIRSPVRISSPLRTLDLSSPVISTPTPKKKETGTEKKKKKKDDNDEEKPKKKKKKDNDGEPKKKKLIKKKADDEDEEEMNFDD